MYVSGPASLGSWGQRKGQKTLPCGPHPAPAPVPGPVLRGQAARQRRHQASARCLLSKGMPSGAGRRGPPASSGYWRGPRRYLGIQGVGASAFTGAAPPLWAAGTQAPPPRAQAPPHSGCLSHCAQARRRACLWSLFPNQSFHQGDVLILRLKRDFSTFPGLQCLYLLW